MKKLLLTSLGSFITTKYCINIFPKPFNEMAIAYINTAVKKASDKTDMENSKNSLDRHNFNYEEIDIEGKNEQYLRNQLKNKEVIYVEGGNVFYLLKHVYKSGFDKIIKDLINQGVICIGASSGGYILCPTVEMALWKKPHRNTFGLTNLSALNLVPFLITAHYDTKYKKLLKEKVSQSKYPVKVITNQQALLIKDDNIELIDEGEEIKI